MKPDSPESRPRDVATGEPLQQTRQPGYYAGFETLSQAAFWDDATRRVVEERVSRVPPIRFFSSSEVRLMQCLCDHLLPQSDRVSERRIPILNYIDDRLAADRIPGYRFDSMPPDGDAYRLGFSALDAIARTADKVDFVDLDWDEQEKLLKALHDDKPWAGAGEVWDRMPVRRWWALVMGDIASAYYAHPWAWDEVGFGGPAYPRGYTRLSHGTPESWEVDEQRYEWTAPEGVLSDPPGVEMAPHQNASAQGQIGTH